jgi:hypothetical protein
MGRIDAMEVAWPVILELLRPIASELDRVTSREQRESYSANPTEIPELLRVHWALRGQERGDDVEIAWATVNRYSGEIVGSGYSPDLESSLAKATSWPPLPPRDASRVTLE